MNRALNRDNRILFGAICLIGLRLATAALGGQAFDLAHARGIEQFAGSATARELLAKNGFVVADPAFKQIFEPYIKSPEMEGPSETNAMSRSLPSFITTDSAWHTYHVLLEEGVKELEEIQSRALIKFSRQLWAAAREQASNAPAGGDTLAWFASVGLALQDPQHREALSPEEKRIVDGLRTGSTPVAMPVGFPLSPLLFRAESFYTQSPELSGYFAARQWYAIVVFRLSNASETRLAVSLATLIESRPELLALWQQLSAPIDALLAPAEDGSVREYAQAAKALIGTNLLDVAALERQVSGIQKALENRLPLPRVSDQALQPDEYADFAKRTRGFRLLPPRRLPCAVCFHETVDPKIPGRMYPSGLDFLAASPVLRSPAAVRAVQGQFGKSVIEVILKVDCGPMPDSLHGEAMQLLARLQEPLPAQVPAAFRTEAWSDLQLWTQLGAWAEQRHTWALHTKLSVMSLSAASPPEGVVAPYPAFFTGLARLSRRTVETFEKAGPGQPFEVKSTASDLLQEILFSRRLFQSKDAKELTQKSAKLEQFSRFQSWYHDQHRHEMAKDRTLFRKLDENLEQLARRCAGQGQASEADTKILRAYFDARQSAARLLKDFAPVCDRLAELANKSLTGQALTEEDETWIENYGITLAGFHFYYGNSYEQPRDDFPIVTRVFSNHLTSAMFYAGLARPQALYVLIPGGEGLQLYRGAVMTYREFIRPNDQLLDDESWRELVSQGTTPPPPPFTRRFFAQKTAGEWIKVLRPWALKSSGDDAANRPDLEEILWQLGAAATDKDLPALFDLLVASFRGSEEDITQGLAEIIGRMQWEPYQKKLIELLKSSNTEIADTAAYILLRRPQSIDVTTIIAGFDTQPVRVRRLYCVLLGSVPHQTEATRKALLHALQSKDDSVRWQAVLALGKAHWPQEPPIAVLLSSLEDANQYVAGAAVQSLFRQRATNTAPVLLARLRVCLKSAPPSLQESRRQVTAIAGDAQGPGPTMPSPGDRRGSHGRGDAFEILDPDDLCSQLGLPVAPRGRVDLLRMQPPMPQRDYEQPHLSPGLADALIESLGLMGYQPATEELFKLLGADHARSAMLALEKLAPDRLTDWLLARAQDRQAPAIDREDALIYLCIYGSTNHLRDLVLLLDETTPIPSESRPPAKGWRICDRTADTIAGLLGWHERLRRFTPPQRREALLLRVKEWAKTQRPLTRQKSAG
jgi:HEAT repeat protein